jgi:hypothetical protein
MLVSETASVDTVGVAGPVGSVTNLSEPGLNQNRLYALQSIERGECVMRLVRSLAGKDRTAFSRKASDWRDAGPQKVPRRTTTGLGRDADRFEGTKRV